MAKELPYFKFEPSMWDTGKIQLVDETHQGFFINLCSLYWQRLGDLPYKLALQKTCKGNTSALQLLIDEHIIVLRDDFIKIKFLDEQLKEFENTSQQNRINALKRWENKDNAKAKRAHNNRNTIREDKIREDKNKEDSINAREQNFRKSLLEFKDKYSPEMLTDFADYWTEPNKSRSKLRFELQQTWDLSRRLTTWAKNDNKFSDKKEKTRYTYYEVTELVTRQGYTMDQFNIVKNGDDKYWILK